MTKISIITVNLNGNRFLAESIDSVLGQDYSDFELLIVDGGSTDGSLVTIEAAAARDSRVRWISEPDRGIADAMNKGIALATGDLIGILHGDDCYPEAGTLSAVVAQFKSHPGVLWLTGGLDMIDQKGEIFRSFSVRNYSYNRLVRSNILFHPATFVRTESLRICGMFNTELKLAMDYDLWLRIGALSDPVVFDRQLACFRVHDGSRSIQADDDALVEEFAIRLSYLRDRGKRVWPYSFHHLIKRIVNGVFVHGLRRSSKQG